jgi:hypothetical protein
VALHLGTDTVTHHPPFGTHGLGTFGPAQGPWPAGEVHAVEDGERRALCGHKPLHDLPNSEWPGLDLNTEWHADCVDRAAEMYPEVPRPSR